MMSPTFALDFAQDWIESWNAHDLERILAHYADDFEMSSPVIAEIMHEPSGTLRGKDVIRTYWAQALAQHPDLRFELMHVFAGASSATIVYRGPRGLSAEVFWFNADNMVSRAAAHYLAS